MKSKHPHNNLWADYRSPLAIRSQDTDSKNTTSSNKAEARNAKNTASRLVKASTVFGRQTRNNAAPVGAVRRNERPNKLGYSKLLVAGSVFTAIASVLYASNAVKKAENQPHPQSSFKQAVLEKAPLPLPSPTFRFDDADVVASNQRVILENQNNLNVLDGRPGQSSAFAPTTFAELLPDDNRNAPTDMSQVLASIGSLEAELPPISHALPRQELSSAASKADLQDNYKKTVVVKAGDTLSGILNDRGVSKDDLPAILDNELVQRYLTNLKIDQKLEFTFRWNGELDNMSVKIDRDSKVILQNATSGYELVEQHLPLEYERVVTSGTIEQSLYLAAERANLKQSTIMTLADIFQWELDFAADIRKGDNFSIVYDRLYRDGKYIGDGEILAAEFIRGDRIHRAIRFTDDENRTAYFSPDGRSKKRSFMRHPVDVVRITSKFNPNRVHPVLHKIRAHKGVDYGAPHGSPIKAVADGRISFAGKRSAYGNTVIIKHDTTRTTLYAHMSKIGAKSLVGKKIKQGDVIGYVGKTGRVTGTHLHYELRIKGKHVDPLKVNLPQAEPLEKKYLARLQNVSNELLAQMRSVTEGINEQVAIAD